MTSDPSFRLWYAIISRLGHFAVFCWTISFIMIMILDSGHCSAYNKQIAREHLSTNEMKK